MVVVPDKGVVGKTYRKDAKPLLAWLEAMPAPQAQELQSQLEKDK